MENSSHWPRYLMINTVVNKIAPKVCIDFDPETNEIKIKLVILKINVFHLYNTILYTILYGNQCEDMYLLRIG